ncbi:MAG: CHASE2 domain-containing protein [Treponema sp.]|nr:CHASE2 domain-containing protein [Treponema sp.]
MRKTNIIIPVAAVGLSSLVAFSTLDFKIADLFQRILPSTEESPQVSMLNINDDSVKNIGTWPFSRDVYAKSFVTLKELGAEAIISDLSFVDESQAQVNLKYIKEDVPNMIDEEFSGINENFTGFLQSKEGAGFTDEEIESSSSEFSAANDEIKGRIKDDVERAVSDVDQILGNTLSIIDNAYLTLTFANEYEVSEESQAFLKDKIALKNVHGENDTLTPEYKGVLPAIGKLLVHAKSAGFVNTKPDADGYTRRVHLLVKYNGDYYGQLTLPSLLDRLGNPEIEVTNSSITLKNAKINGRTKDISIPRDKTGAMLLKFPKKQFHDYNCISLWEAYSISEREESVKNNINLMYDAGFFDSLDENPYDISEAAKFNLDVLMNSAYESPDITFNEYLELRKNYFEVLEVVFAGALQKTLLEENKDDAEVVKYINDTFEVAKENYKSLIDARNELKEKVKGRTFLIGTTATSTTDYGLNQYEEHYPNPGVHYTVQDMILAEDFVNDCPIWFSIAIALILCFSYSFITIKVKDTLLQILIGIGLIAIEIAFLLAVFFVTRTYVGTAVPTISLLLTFVSIIILGFIVASNDKKFLKNAFSQCLSPDVVDQVVNNPSSFKLGGETVEMSAIFTDIQKFSSFSELLTAPQLVALLNYYLTRMSDIIMGEKGTVDKYEGDAIVAFVGAPIKMSDHATRICSAALKMKKAEIEMNAEIVKIATLSDDALKAKIDEQVNALEDEKEQAEVREKLCTLYETFRIMVKNKKTLFTRIGINSGEMTAGYMGSDNKKNYTMMGNNVNLASRLEGVNKQYSTAGIMISEHTRKLLGDRFVVRSLDRVQVVNVKTPMRLYELVAEKSESNEQLLKYMENWEKVLKVFEARDYAKALEYLKKLSSMKIEQYPDDKVAKYYINLIENFFIKGTYPTDKDDAGVAFNPENGVFTLLQK